MRIKQRLEDFRVRELLHPDAIEGRGPWRVYRVTKRKLTSLQAAQILARAQGASAGEVSMAGLKDRQGVTVQHMALRGGRELHVRDKDLRIEAVGFSSRELSSAASTGNAFDLTIRGLDEGELRRIREALPAVRAHGLPNYFDDQRFGNLRSAQGWIVLGLIQGRHEQALRRLLATVSEADDARNRSFKLALDRAWGDWTACREIAGRYREHHSVFGHLKRHPDDFAGAFYHVASRLRLIHLYAFQSHLWNRAVDAYIERITPPGLRARVSSREGPLTFSLGGYALDEGMESFRLPGPKLADVTHALQLELLEEALAGERLAPAQFSIEGVSGFQLKGEERQLLVRPQRLRARPPEPDTLNRGRALARLRFELPRGAYATLVVKRLLARAGEGDGPERFSEAASESPPEDARAADRPRSAVPAPPRSRRAPRAAGRRPRRARRS
jgi:tRNA pseudouridine13 synthase